ncbi:MAG: flagellar protein export ATPase FliI, partial [Alphaproteobacteria bacterium]|nr:flagellar protein export ATPase FliI [Alphaproteobacteria bacterium]
MAVAGLVEEISRIQSVRVHGHVASVQGLMLEVGGVERLLSVGSRLQIEGRDGRLLRGEVVGFRNGKALVMPYGSVDGVGLGCRAYVAEDESFIRPDGRWLGRVVNALAEPIDNGPPLPQGRTSYKIRAEPPPAHKRRRVGAKLDLGVRAVNSFLTACQGQRMGIFAGSGIGKSILLSMFARFTAADVIVIGLVGERGREVQEFLEDDLGPEGLARSVVVVATSDEPPLMRRQAAHMTMAIAEYFRDQGNQVLCLMDSVTRFAMSMREIGLSTGEPPANKGYTPSVFSELPRLLERAGPGTAEGSITGLFTVLVEGDDVNEPVSDAVRGIIDGHIVLDRGIADRGRYPAINILKSVSRMLPDCNTPEENQIVTRARSLLATYDEMNELIRIGA